MRGGLLLLLVLVVVAAVSAPTEGLAAKGPQTDRPVVPVPMPSVWPSPWDMPTDEPNGRQPRPYVDPESCAKVAGPMASFMCPTKGGNNIG
jgi:hypothetical protein